MIDYTPALDSGFRASESMRNANRLGIVAYTLSHIIRESCR